MASQVCLADSRSTLGLCLALVLLVTAAWPTATVAAADSNERDVTLAIDDLSAMPRQVRKVVYKSTRQAERGEQERAIATLQKHLSNHPDQDHFQIRLRLAHLLAKSGQTAAAAVQYEAATELEPRLAQAWFGLAQTNYELDRYAQAGAAFESGYRADADHSADALYYAAAAYLQAEQPADALPLFQELTGGAHDPAHLDWYRGVVSAALTAGQPAEADPALARMLSEYADDPDAWYLVYQFAASDKSYQRAAVALTITGYLRPLTREEQRRLGDVLNITGVPALASKHYTAAMSDDPSEGDYERLASALLASHEVDEAQQVLESALQRRPQARLWSLLGDVHYLRREYDAAYAAFLEVARLDAENGRAYLMQGYCALEMGDRETAEANLEKAINYPEHEEIARALLRRAENLDPKSQG